MSKLYDQLRKAASLRRAAQERNATRAPASVRAQPGASEPLPNPHEEIRSKLEDADASLGQLRSRAGTMTTLVEAALRRVEAESQGVDRARERESIERSLREKSEALTAAEVRAAELARTREATERAAMEEAARRAEQERMREAASRTRDRKSTRLNSSHIQKSRMPSSA